MSWSCTRDDETVTEWERADGYATVRLRERADGDYVVRLDVMEQAADERTYARRTFDDREAAEAQTTAWRTERTIE